MVDDVEQAGSAFIHTAYQLQAAYRKLVEAYILVFFDARQRSDVPDLVMLRHIQILQNSSGSNDTILQMFHSETFQVLGFEMFQQLFAGRRFGKYPVVQLEGKELTAEVTFEHRFLSPFEQDFFRGKIIQ